MPQRPISLPAELWHCIAKYLPKHELSKMLEVNGSLFKSAMDERYRELSLIQLDGNMVDYVAHLSSPFIVPRVRTLRIRPYFMQQLRDPFCKDIITRLETLLLSFARLQECHIAWYDNDIPLYISEATHNLLRNAISASTRLRKLSLVTSLPKLEALLSPGVALTTDGLANLEVSIISDEGDETPFCSVESVMTSCLAPFVTQNQRSLKTFAFGASSPIQATSLFETLACLSDLGLESLELSIPCSAPFLGDSSSMSAFLRSQGRTLRSLAIRGVRCSGDRFELAGWMQEGFTGDNVRLINLESIVISTAFLPIDVVVLCVGRLSQNSVGRCGITSLEVTGKSLSFEQVDRMLLPKGLGGLKRVKLGRVSLSPELVDLLAERLTGLEEMEIWVKDVRAVKDAIPIYGEENGNLRRLGRMRRQVTSQVEDFYVEMRKRHGSYSSWTELRRVRVLKFAGKLQNQTELSKAITDCLHR